MKEQPKNSTLPEVLSAYERLDAARFHMPGHKGQTPLWPVTKWDVTEISGTDNLTLPEGPLLALEEAWARACGAKHSFLLVNGSTAGILAMLLALGESKHVLVGRDCHKSVASGLALAGHTASFVYPAFENALDGVVTADAVEAALSENETDAVLITSPNFYGLCADVESIARVCRAHGALLLVDSAHGAHFPFSPLLPSFPAEHVDMWCVSAHKTLPALTQAAILHLGKNAPFTMHDIRRVLTMVQTTSPSYLLMASLDWALHEAKRADYKKQIERVEALSARLNALNGISVFSPALLGRAGIFAMDPTRLVLDVSARGIDGRAAIQAMEEHRVVAEMADALRVVFITAPADRDEWYDMLFEAAKALPYGRRALQTSRPPVMRREACMPIREAVLSKAELVSLTAAKGRICAQAAGAYPPGIAAVYPGERIEEEDVRYLLAQKELSIPLFGAPEGRLCVVKEG